MRWKSNQWSFSQRTPVTWRARGRCGIIFPWLARDRASVPPRIPLHKQELRHLLLLGSQCPGGLVALFNILIGEKRLRFVWVASSRGCVHVLAIVPFWLISVRIDWQKRGWCSTKESFEESFVVKEGRERERGYNEKERKKRRTAGTETRIRRRIQCDFDTGAKSP